MYYCFRDIDIIVVDKYNKMPDHKQMCKYCKTRHLPPTGKKCQKKKMEEDEGNNELFRDAAVAGSTPASQMDQGDGQWLQLEILQQLQKMTQRLDKVEERMSSTAVTSTPDKPELSSDTFFLKVLSQVKVNSQNMCQVVRPRIRVMFPP